MPGWRALLAFGVTGVAGALAYRGDWAVFVLAATVVVLPVSGWVYGELAATREMMCGQGRHRKRHGPLDAAMAALAAAARMPPPEWISARAPREE